LVGVWVGVLVGVLVGEGLNAGIGSTIVGQVSPQESLKYKTIASSGTCKIRLPDDIKENGTFIASLSEPPGLSTCAIFNGLITSQYMSKLHLESPITLFNLTSLITVLLF
jgi:hypothetical protein